MKTIWPKIALLLLCCAILAFELWHFRSSSGSASKTTAHSAQKSDFALLPATEIVPFNETYAKLLPNPGVHIRSWEPTLGDMQEVESELSQISKLKHRNLGANNYIDASQYLRQYLAVEIDGSNLLLVNGLCPALYKRGDNWRKWLIFVNDGGACHWHAIYNPSTRQFSDFGVNGG